MPYASLEDINVHLPEDKLEVDDARYAPLELDAERIVRGNLAGFVAPATIAAWADPGTTPEIVRAIAGRLVAAFYYKQRYSEDSLEVPQYAQDKYDEAIMLLMQIRSGTIVIPDVDVSGADRLTSDMFWPNDTTSPTPIFTMDMNP